MRSNPSGIIVLKKYTNSVQKTYREAEYMFQFNAELIQAEFGENAAAAYTPKDNRSWIDKLGGASPPDWTDQLIHLTAQLREKLSKTGVAVPYVKFSIEPELPPDEFRISLGVGGGNYNYKKIHFIDALKKMVLDYHVPNLNSTTIQTMSQACIQLLIAQNYQEAMEQCMKLYYCACLIGADKEATISLLNMTAICVINKEYYAAFLTAKQAQILAESKGKYDPFLKYYSHKSLANVLAILKDFTPSAAMFHQAYQDIECTVNPAPYIVDALWNEVIVLTLSKNWGQCISVLAEIEPYITVASEENHQLLLKISKIKDVIIQYQSKEIADLESKVLNLQAEYAALSQSFLITLKDTAITVFSKCGPYMVSMFAGSLMSPKEIHKYHQCQFNQNGNNVIKL